MYYFMTFIVGVKLKVTRMSHRWQCRGWGGRGESLCNRCTLSNECGGREARSGTAGAGGGYLYLGPCFPSVSMFHSSATPGPALLMLP